MNREDMLLGGTGLSAYAFKATLYCVDCGRDIICKLVGVDEEVDEIDSTDSDQYPQPVFFGENDHCEEYCDDCGEYLYGEEEYED